MTNGGNKFIEWIEHTRAEIIETKYPEKHIQKVNEAFAGESKNVKVSISSSELEKIESAYQQKNLG